MNRYSYLFFMLFAGVMALLQGCRDDDFRYGALGDGEAYVTLEASFTPFAEGNLTRGQNSGDILKPLRNVSILVYGGDDIRNDENEIVHGLLPEHCIWDYKWKESDLRSKRRGDSDASNGTSAEEETLSLSGIEMKLPFGSYYIVAVANLKLAPGQTSEDYLTQTDDCHTLEGLRRLKVKWDATKIDNNAEMLGFFTDAENENVPHAGSEFTKVSVNRPGINLHSWLRRCASKITIDFDGSNLRENVYIYIKEARIYDIASDCTLGFGQTSDMARSEIIPDFNNHVQEGGMICRAGEELTEADQLIQYGSGESYEAWPLITKGTPTLPDTESLHLETANALYFYENMQGINSDPGKLPVTNVDKDNTPTGGLVMNDKDNVANGTYIEVTAHYHSDADGNISSGDIKYRFMLGKDNKEDYNAERNYHYKLTLSFHGNANDFDWHIEYEDPPGFNVPNPWYVSYLYNQEATLPFKYTPPSGYELVRVEAKITHNPWYPTGLSDSELTHPDADLLKFSIPEGDDSSPFNTDQFKNNNQNCNGFLSLRRAEDTVLTDVEACGQTFGNFGSYYKRSPINEKNYKGEIDGIPKDNRTYDAAHVYDSSDPESYSVQMNGDAVSFKIPLFTREKVLVKQTGYTGMNPFVGSQRVARIELTPYIRKKGTSDTPKAGTPENVNVVQVRRIVNPKGVYRKSGNNEPFHVRLMHLDSDQLNAQFSQVYSHGPWKADIIGDDNFITLDGKSSISGSTGTPIDFTIRFNRMNNSPDDGVVRNAVVRISYHNFTCNHLIFVRQGYAPQCLAETGKQYGNENAPGTVWSTFNMISQNLAAKDPRDEGSMFKFGNGTQAIDAINNAYTRNGKETFEKRAHGEFGAPERFRIISKDRAEGNSLDYTAGTLDETTVEWKDIKPNPGGFTEGLIAGAATMRDFEQLYLTKNIEFGYGVLYADGATETQEDMNTAYGYSRYTANSDGSSEKGMRGMFAYHWDSGNLSAKGYNGRSVFFPIGRSGYGHRKNSYEGPINAGKGILRYSSIRYQPSHLDGGAGAEFQYVAPLFESLFRQDGAVYWCRHTVADKNYLPWDGVAANTEGIGYGLDINYYSYDVNAISGISVGYKNHETNNPNPEPHGDACFVRCVVR